VRELILKELRSICQRELASAKEAYESSHDYATHGEVKSDGKYDTRGIEAGYLAGAQKRRVLELEGELALLEKLAQEKPTASDVIAIGSVFEMKSEGGEKNYFLSPTTGGYQIEIDSQQVLVLGLQSPLGRETVGLAIGESFEIVVKNVVRVFEITKLNGACDESRK